MGIYNCADTLQEALGSLYAQTFQDFEIILCDDGSADNTLDIAMQNKSVHKNIIVTRNETNQGLNITLNRCLALAKGEYIARMDGDDISLPDRFRTEVEFLDNHPEYAIVSSPMEYFDANGVFRRGVGKGEVFQKDFVMGSPICHAPCMVRREAYEAVGGYSVSPRLIRIEDYHLWFKMYAAGFKAYILEKPYYQMRDDQSAAKRRTFKNRLNEFYVKWIGFGMIHLPFYYKVFAFKPIIVGLIPSALYNRLHRDH